MKIQVRARIYQKNVIPLQRFFKSSPSSGPPSGERKKLPLMV